MKDNEHGTSVARIIAAEDNNIGVLSVAPEASVYAVKVLKSSGSGYTSDVIRGIEWVIANDMDIISMNRGETGGNNAYKAAMDNACNSGLILIASAGNYGSNDHSFWNTGIWPEYSGNSSCIKWWDSCFRCNCRYFSI